MSGAASPSGPASKAALIDAVRDLLNDDPTVLPGARAIARRAGVNHSLVFRHFSSVDDLIGKVASAQVLDRFGAIDDAGATIDRLVVALSALRSVRAALGLVDVKPTMADGLTDFDARRAGLTAEQLRDRSLVVLWSLIGYAASAPITPDADEETAFVASLAALLEAP